MEKIKVILKVFLYFVIFLIVIGVIAKFIGIDTDETVPTAKQDNVRYELLIRGDQREGELLVFYISPGKTQKDYLDIGLELLKKYPKKWIMVFDSKDKGAKHFQSRSVRDNSLDFRKIHIYETSFGTTRLEITPFDRFGKTTYHVKDGKIIQKE